MPDDLPFEIIWLDEVGGTPTIIGREHIEAYNLDQAISLAENKLHHQRGLAASARGFLVHSLRGDDSQEPENPALDEAVVNIRDAIRIIAPIWEDMHRFGHTGADDVAGAQASLEQAVRFITGEETPS